ncbi:Protein Wnt-10a [Holothuria leucospilota]|uniref:Protein Wnt n=1 Tax=Holothuria leucospilota TaxID=206669 RepID=A0A9Q0YDB4_HOLLE|nr:Protein Wnt-10a [Holothuria leucospilota]
MYRLAVIYTVCVSILCYVHIIMALSSNQISSSFIDSASSKEDGRMTRSKSIATICRSYSGLTKKQRQICRRSPDVTAAAIKGIDTAVLECQHQMVNRRWNCSSLVTRSGNPFKAKIMKRGFSETAFVRAIISAGILLQVTRSCSMGSLRSCGCDTSYSGRGDGFEWGGCSHDTGYGEKFCAEFVDSMDKSRDSRSRMNVHNNKAGRLLVINDTKKQCKCHGMSGSCEVMTCWQQTPHYRDVAYKLLKKYNNAVEVRPRNSNNGQLEVVSNRVNSNSKGRNSPSPTDLVYLERSPDFCTPDSSVGSPGTKGRYCNRTSMDYDGCDSMCCGRGYNVSLKESIEWCNCTFHWCCFVKCRQCSTQEWVNQCK